MNILITGGAGFIGTHLVTHLLRRTDRSVVVLDNLYRGKVPKVDQTDGRLSFVEGDIRDRGLLARVMNDVDVVVHLAAQSNVLGAVADLEYSFSTNVVGTFNVLTAAAQAGVKRVLFASSREVYGEQQSLPVKEVAELKPKNAYGASKLAGETYCRVFRSGGLSVIILRLANVYGPGDRDRVIPIFVENALRGNSLVLYGGNQLLDFVWVGTVVGAFERAMESDLAEDAVNIGSGIGTTVRELAHTVAGKTGSNSVIVNAASRSCETTAFIADIRRAVECGLINSPDDSLQHLDAVVNDMRNHLSAEGISAAGA